jgi:hypothetical protein
MVTIVQLCRFYDRAQEAARDPKRRQKQDNHLTVMANKRKALDKLLDHLMIHVGKKMYDWDVSIYVAELAYFNTWFNRRGGWAGGRVIALGKDRAR